LLKNDIGWKNCTATPAQTLKTDGVDAPGSGIEKQNTKRFQGSIHWQNLSGLIGKTRRISLKYNYPPVLKRLFPINPRGECVIKTILTGPFIIKVTNPPLI
jgi:hypothetical protein